MTSEPSYRIGTVSFTALNDSNRPFHTVTDFTPTFRKVIDFAVEPEELNTITSAG